MFNAHLDHPLTTAIAAGPGVRVGDSLLWEGLSRIGAPPRAAPDRPRHLAVERLAGFSARQQAETGYTAAIAPPACP